MKHRMLLFGIVVSLLIFVVSFTSAQRNSCTTIQSGELLTSNGDVITPGHDQWGYNYQAHRFNGYYCDAYQDASWCQAYKDTRLAMTWNEAWLSNKDCNGDGVLDRHLGFDSYRGSNAWLTNHMSGTYEDGVLCEWDYFVKIIAAPLDATNVGEVWYSADSTEIGPAIWGAFAIIHQVENDSCAGIEGVQYSSPDHAGFGGLD